jgi:hypothetical protein
MRLTRIAKAFDDPDYIFELKHDGFRAIAYIEVGECKLVSRNLKHFKSFDHLKKSLRGRRFCTWAWLRNSIPRRAGKAFKSRRERVQT